MGDTERPPDRRGDDGKDRKVFVGGLNFDADEAQLRQDFGKYGDIEDIFLPRDRDTQKPRGFGFVTFAGYRDAEDAAAEMNGLVAGARSPWSSGRATETAAAGAAVAVPARSHHGHQRRRRAPTTCPTPLPAALRRSAARRAMTTATTAARRRRYDDRLGTRSVAAGTTTTAARLRRSPRWVRRRPPPRTTIVAALRRRPWPGYDDAAATTALLAGQRRRRSRRRASANEDRGSMHRGIKDRAQGGLRQSEAIKVYAKQSEESLRAQSQRKSTQNDDGACAQGVRSGI